MKYRFRNKKAMTLVEVMVASAIFAFAFGALMIGERSARINVEKSLISFISLQYAQGLLEAIQSYPFDNPDKYKHTETAVNTDAHSAFLLHPVTLPDYDTSTSGVYDDDDKLVERLTEEQLGLRYHPTTIPSGATSSDPFTRSSSLQNNISLLGPETNNISSSADLSTGFYKINTTERGMNIFSSAGTGQEKYFFMDDVDDFDGYREVRTILPDQGITVTFDVSVSGVFGNQTNYTYPITNNGTATINQAKFSIMQYLSLANILTLAPSLSGAADPLSENEKMAYGYYNCMLFKKITVKGTWEYPQKSGKMYSIVLDGGKISNFKKSVI